MLPGVTRCCQVVIRCDQLVFWHSGNGKKKCFGIAGIARKVFWRCIGEEKSVLAFRECREKCFGVGGMARKVFWCCRSGIVGMVKISVMG